MLHPAAAHFAISLPIISFVLGLTYIYKQTELMSKVSTRFIVFSSIVLIVAFFSGKNDGEEVYMLLSEEGQELLKQHKQIGLFLVIGMVIAAVIKFYGCFKKSFKMEIFAIILVAIISVGVLYQGKIGGDLTYTYGAHVKDHSDGMDCLDDPEDFLEEVKE